MTRPSHRRHPSGRRSRRGCWSTPVARRSTSRPPRRSGQTPYHYGGTGGIPLSTVVRSRRVRARPGKHGAAPLRRHHADIAAAAPPRRDGPAADAGSVHPVGLRRGAADRRRPDRLRRRRLHHERELSVCRARDLGGARSATPARRCAPRSTRSRAVSTCTSSIRPTRSHGRGRRSSPRCSGPTTRCRSSSAPPPVSEGSVCAQATAYETFHATRPDVFASSADAWSRPIALSGTDRGRRRRRLRRVGRGRPPAGHASVVHVFRSSRADPAARPRQHVLQPAPGTEPGRHPERLDRRPGPTAPDASQPSPGLGHPGTGPDEPAGVRDAARQQSARPAQPRDPRPQQVVARHRAARARRTCCSCTGGVVQIQSLYEGRGPGLPGCSA